VRGRTLSNSPSIVERTVVEHLRGAFALTLLTEGKDVDCLGDPSLWRQRALDSLTVCYGERAPEVLGLTQQLIDNDSRIGRLMFYSGLRNFPDIIVALAPHAVSAAQSNTNG
jgi:hypothetical protein